MVYLIIFVFAFPFSWMSIYWNNKLSVIYMAIKKKMHYSLKIWITQSKYWFTINQSINSTKNKYIKKKIILKGKINIFFFFCSFSSYLIFLVFKVSCFLLVVLFRNRIFLLSCFSIYFFGFCYFPAWWHFSMRWWLEVRWCWFKLKWWKEGSECPF